MIVVHDSIWYYHINTFHVVSKGFYHMMWHSMYMWKMYIFSELREACLVSESIVYACRPISLLRLSSASHATSGYMLIYWSQSSYKLIHLPMVKPIIQRVSSNLISDSGSPYNRCAISHFHDITLLIVRCINNTEALYVACDMIDDNGRYH